MCVCVLFYLTFWLFKQDLNIPNWFHFKFSYLSHTFCPLSCPHFLFNFVSFLLHIFFSPDETTYWQIIMLIINSLSSPKQRRCCDVHCWKGISYYYVRTMAIYRKKSVSVVYDVLIWNAMQIEPNTSTKTRWTHTNTHLH